VPLLCLGNRAVVPGPEKSIREGNVVHVIHRRIVQNGFIHYEIYHAVRFKIINVHELKSRSSAGGGLCTEKEDRHVDRLTGPEPLFLEAKALNFIEI
jgi:hypothetical protein